MPRKKWDNLEKEWDKVRPVTMTETGVSAKLRTIQLPMKGYSRDFVNETSGPDSAKSDDERFQKGFDAYLKTAKALLTIDPRVAKNAKTKKFIEELIADLEEEKAFWDGDPCQKKHGGKKVKFSEDTGGEDPAKGFKLLAAKLQRAGNYQEAARQFAIGSETCFPGQKSVEKKLKAFAGAFKAIVEKVNKCLAKDPPDVTAARSEVNRLKTAPPQLAREFPDGGALLQKAVEDALVTPLEHILAQHEAKQTEAN